jgi:alcohol oxidase
MYTRASKSDYDDWETVYENPGWGSKDLLPLLKKVSPSFVEVTQHVELVLPSCLQTENYEVDFSEQKQPTHGYSGPLSVSSGGVYTELGASFLEASVQFDNTRPMVEDINNLETSNGYGVRHLALYYCVN